MKNKGILRAIKILEYLRKNSDSEHPVKKSDLLNSCELKPYMGDKEACRDTIIGLAIAMNFDEYDIRPEEDWKICFKAFKNNYSAENLDSQKDDDIPKLNLHGGVYYNHTFTYDEINNIIDGIMFSKTLDTKSANELIEKIENNLTSKFYKKSAKRICKVKEPTLVDKELLRRNLLTIQQAIDNKVQVSFFFNGYDREKRLVRNHIEKYTVSPYYIVASGGRYYLLACINSFKNMSIWRIDLMTELEIPKPGIKPNSKGLPALEKKEVKNLPDVWTDEFQLSHLNMSFDRPVTVKLRIKSPKDENLKPLRADYTFMYDWFGDTFKYFETEKHAPYNDIVMVKCSPFAMVNWALQYSDRVEVLEPKSIRGMIIEKIRNLNEKYMEE